MEDKPPEKMPDRVRQVYSFAFTYRASLWHGLARKRLRARIAAGSRVNGQWVNSTAVELTESELEEGAQNILALAWDRLQRPNNRTDNPERDIAVAIRFSVRAYRRSLGHEKPSRQYVDAMDGCRIDADLVSALVVRQSADNSGAVYRQWIRRNVPRELWTITLALSATGGEREPAAELSGIPLRTFERRVSELQTFLLG